MLSIHLPYVNGRIYWDAGNSGGSIYDRIDKLATSEEYEGKWQHWVFTKDAVAGIMEIYFNGDLWHSGSGRTRTMSGITNFAIGSTYSCSSTYRYDGFIDEFRIYSEALSSAQIKKLYVEGAKRLGLTIE